MSNVYVVDSTAKRTQVKVTAATYMREVLEQACKGRRLNPENYALKTATDKFVDLSQPFRYSGLTAGAKLQLVQASRSPGVVNVAIQLPDTAGGTRISDKFPSTTSLWLVLRKFEDGVAASTQSTQKLNLTQRAVPDNVGEGAGRLLYEQPCLSMMQRTVEGFQDLQKTLGQLGLNGGTVLMRLSFKNSGRPLEEAMKEISEHFSSTQNTVEGGSSGTGEVAEHSESGVANGGIYAPSTEVVTSPQAESKADEPSGLAVIEPVPTTTQPAIEDQNYNVTSGTPSQQMSAEQIPTVSSTANGISIYRPPTSSTPAAALAPDDPTAFEPSIDQARALQNSLQSLTQNKRLKSDKEIAELETTKQQQLAAVKNVVVRVQYPDQHQIELTITSTETASDLYARVRETLRGPSEPFDLRHTSAKGQQETLPPNSTKRLVHDFAFRGRVLVRLAPPFTSSSSPQARANLTLKPDLMADAKELKVELLASQQAAMATAEQEAGAKGNGTGKGKGRAGTGDVEARMKKFLGFGGKK
ncbi:hypothetical protein LTR62_003763 [Meristemomyces frigidus]|uniref:TUG ubiquitin-like domain-containing protein n=1 Tax=Meristemomyces frigidus TaxID=1508187 RepID=A0AAN7TF57_9PEZI|nr:hypothetical protein LTR62_003763 [Meristemomyces frigidus]